MRARHADKLDLLKGSTLLAWRRREEPSPAEKIAAVAKRNTGPQAVFPLAYAPGSVPDEDLTQASGEGEESAAQPQPSFTPAPPAPTGQQPVLRTPTGPMNAVPADSDPYSPENQERATAARAAVEADPLGVSLDLLARVHEGLLKLPVDRAGRFAADRQDLVFFRQVTKSLGWCGLHAERKPPARQRPPYTAGHWYADAMRLVAEATDKARYEVFGHINEFTVQEDRIRMAENAANGLGYPGTAA